MKSIEFINFLFFFLWAGLLHLQLEHIVHKDVAARNVLVSNDWRAKISDFGLSRVLGR